MELSFELPHSQLPNLGEHNDFNFTLAHLLPNEQYTTHYRESNKYTICDNSAFELSTPLSAPEVVKAASIFKAQEVIAPDAFGSASDTIRSTNEFIKYLEDSGNLGKFRVMGVVQGANAPDWVNCFLHMRENKHIDVIGFSYVGCKSFHPDLTTARITATHMATHSAGGDLKKPIHLLGVGGNPLELQVQKTIEQVRSCDTSIPIVQGLAGDKLHPISGLLGNKLPRPHDYFETNPTAEQLEAIIHNIKLMKTWAAGAPRLANV